MVRMMKMDLVQSHLSIIEIQAHYMIMMVIIQQAITMMAMMKLQIMIQIMIEIFHQHKFIYAA